MNACRLNESASDLIALEIRWGVPPLSSPSLTNLNLMVLFVQCMDAILSMRECYNCCWG